MISRFACNARTMKSSKKKVEAGRVPDIAEFSNLFARNDVSGLNVFLNKFDNEELNQVSDAFGWSLLMHAANSSPEICKAASFEGVHVNHQSNHGLTALMIGARKNDPVIVQLLLDIGADPALVDNRGSTALHWAVSSPAAGRAGGSETVALLLKQFPDGVDLADRATGSTPLMLAARQRRIEEMKSLLRSGARVDMRDSQGRKVVDIVAQDAMNSDWLNAAKPMLTGIIGSAADGKFRAPVGVDDSEASRIAWAIHHGHVSALEVLLAEDVRPPLTAEAGISAQYREVIELLQSSVKAQKQLYAAVCSQSPSFAKELIDSNIVCVQRPDDNVGMKPLDWAAIAGAKDAAQLIIAAGSTGGSTALDIALLSGNAEVAKLLLQKHKPSARLLGLAIRGGNLACVQALVGSDHAKLAASTHPPAPSSPKKQPVVPGGTTSPKKKEEPTGLMVELVAIVDEAQGFTPLLFAASLGRSEICRELLKVEGMHQIATDPKGRDAFLVACAAGEVDTALDILKQMGDKKVKEQDMYGSNCLALALRAKEGQVPAKQIENLMRTVALDKWKTADSQGCTPLMHAAEVGRPEIVELLIEHGKFNPTVRCRRRKLAADYAREAGWVDVALLLEKKNEPQSADSATNATTRHSSLALAGLSLARPAVPQASTLVAIALPGVRVENIHPSVTSNVLSNYFEAKNIQVKNAAVAVDPITRFSLGYAFVELADKKELGAALRENGKKLLGRKLRVYLDEALPLKLVKKWSAEAGADVEPENRVEISLEEKTRLIEFIKNPPHAKINKKIAEFLFDTAVEAAAKTM